MVRQVLLAAVLAVAGAARAGETLSLDPDWRFIKQDVKDGQAVALDDSRWLGVSVPHTYNDVDTFDTYSLSGHRGEQDQWGGVVWYRKHFTAPEAWRGKKVFVEFEAVRQIGEVYLNGVKLGVSKTGFVPFGFDLTPHLKIGADNVLAVRVDNRFMKDPHEADGMSHNGRPTTMRTQNPLNLAPPAGSKLADLQKEFNESIPENVEDLRADQIPWNNPHWHPAHGGIYRNVYLHVTDPVHIELPLYSFLQTAGPYVWTSDASEKSATLHVDVPVVNESGQAVTADVVVRLLDHDRHEVASLEQANEQIDAGKRGESALAITIPHPKLWEPDHPYLYTAECSVSVAGKPVDTVSLPVGVRWVRWTVDHGFFINGHHLKLHGWGQKPTDEWAGLGAAQPDWLHAYTLDLMKQAGGNWVRWGHCAAGPGMIRACDDLGVMVEQPGVDGESDTVRAAWKLRASAFRDVVIYYRNDPSIMIWEGGNQKVTRDHATDLKGFVEKYDPHGGRAYAHRRPDKVTGEFMDVQIGTEGGRELKGLPVVEGEYDREESPRRVWDDCTPRPLSTDPAKIVMGYPEAAGMTYDLTSEQYAVNEVAQWVKKCGAEDHCGGSNWIFSDTTSGGRVPAEVTRAGGEVDGVRLRKQAYYVCQVMFDPRPRVHIIGHWNYPAGTTKTMYVAGNTGGTVELFVNGKSVGKTEPQERYLYTFPDVRFEPGEIEARGCTPDGKVIATDAIKTAGPPARVKLTAITAPGGWRADGSDVALIDAEVVDKDGRRCPTFYGPASFDVTGPAVWRGGYNSGREHSTNATTLGLECGINRVALKSTLQAGTVTIKATVPGVGEGEVQIPSRSIEENAGVSPDLPSTATAGR